MISLATAMKRGRLAAYTYWDLPGGVRLHHWQPSGKWAVGNGPISYIDEAQAKRLLEGRAA